MKNTYKRDITRNGAIQHNGCYMIWAISINAGMTVNNRTQMQDWYLFVQKVYLETSNQYYVAIYVNNQPKPPVEYTLIFIIRIDLK